MDTLKQFIPSLSTKLYTALSTGIILGLLVAGAAQARDIDESVSFSCFKGDDLRFQFQGSQVEMFVADEHPLERVRKGKLRRFDRSDDDYVVVEGEFMMANYELLFVAYIDLETRSMEFDFVDSDDGSEFREEYACSRMKIES